MICPIDGHLLRSFRGGDARAFARMVESHQAALLRHARALLGPGGQHEDVVQEVFLKLAQNPPEIPAEVDGDPRLEQAHLVSWLHTVTRNGCMDVIRAESRRRRREQHAAASEAIEGGLTRVEERDTRDAVERELNRLPVDQREVLVLRLLGERSYREIAEITGRKIGTVGWLISEGLKALADSLAPVLEPAPARNTGPAASSRLDRVQGELS